MTWITKSLVIKGSEGRIPYGQFVHMPVSAQNIDTGIGSLCYNPRFPFGALCFVDFGKLVNL